MTRNAFAAAIALVLTVLVIGSGDPYPHWRYLYPLLLLAALLAAKGLQSIAPKLSGFQAPEFRGKALRDNLRYYFGLSGIIFLAIIQASMIADKTRIPESALLSRAQQGIALLVSQDREPHLDATNPLPVNLHYLAAWLIANSSPSDTLATSEVGVVAYYSGVRILDTFGLVDEYIAHLPGVPGGKMDTDYVFNKRPRFIAFKVDDGCVCGGTPADNQILTDWRLQRDYDLVRIFPAGYAKLLLFRLRDTPAFQVYYDFTREFSYEIVTFVRSDGETTSNLQLARELTGNQIVTALMTDEQRMQGINALSPAEEASSPDFSAADAMRSWLNNWRRLLYHYPYTNELRPEIRYFLQIPANAVLRFGLGQFAEFWDPKYGDGVLYEIKLIEASGDEVIIFSRYLDAKNNPGDRGWQDFIVDLSPWAGETITLAFVASPGENNNRDYDFGGWGQPQILIADAPWSNCTTRVCENIVRHTSGTLTGTG